MESDSPRADVEDRLRETAEAMSERLSSLEEELSSTGTSLRDWVAENPWKSVGGMLAAGVAVGMLFGGRRSDRRPEHAELLEQYIDALRARVDEEVAAGKSPGQALEEALRNHAPLVVYKGGGQTDSGSRRGVLSQSVGFVLRTVFREVARDVILSMIGKKGGEEIDEEFFE